MITQLLAKTVYFTTLLRNPGSTSILLWVLRSRLVQFVLDGPLYDPNFHRTQGPLLIGPSPWVPAGFPHIKLYRGLRSCKFSIDIRLLRSIIYVLDT